MGIERINFDVGAVAATIQQVGDRAIKHGIEVMRVEAQEIANLAREYAPVDEGDLERAIQVSDNEARDDRNRKTVSVGVDPTAPGSGGVARALDYAVKLHELQVPFGVGSIGLGPGSQQKDAGRGVVGGKFMERAVLERQKILSEKLARMWKAQFER